MFKLIITGISLERKSEAVSDRKHRILLELRAEREVKQTLELGRFSFGQDLLDLRLPPGLTYVAATPIRVRALSQSRVLTTDLGVHTLHAHLHDDARDGEEGSLDFGTRRRGRALVRIRYRVVRLRLRHAVRLGEVRCLQQTWWPVCGADQLLSRVGAAAFDLGTFRAFDAVEPEAFQLSVLATTRAHFSVRRRLCREEILGTVSFVPADEQQEEEDAPQRQEGGAGAGQRPSLRVTASGGTCEHSADGSTVVVTLAQRYVLVFHVGSDPLEVAVPVPSWPSAVPGEDATSLNHVQVLVDGLQTFERYFHALVAARHSIGILAWELSLSFGLITAERAGRSLPRTTPSGVRWVSLEDVLLAKALEGVAVRIVVWRHQLLSYLNRFLYLGDVTIEAEVRKLVLRGQSVGVRVEMVHSSSGQQHAGGGDASDPHGAPRAGITVVIVGNPRGLLSSHHEKLVLVDAECADGRGTAFVGGFDIARGRYDQPLHQIPRPYFELHPPQQQAPRYTGPAVQPVLRRIRFLWHDVQVELSGPIVQRLHLHFAQRWVYAFTGSGEKARAHALPPLPARCGRDHGSALRPAAERVCDSTVQLVRCWRGVLDGDMMFDAHRQMIRRAKRFLFIEHQYPFHNWGLSHEMCEALRANPALMVVIVTAVKTDLPTGIVGDLVDWSQDHITQHLLHIEREAPGRVLVVGLCRQDEYRRLIKPIYVHSKLVIVDDELIVTGSANMDDMSFFYSSELTLNISNPALARDTRLRLASEHLGRPFDGSFDEMFEAFSAMGTENLTALARDTPLAGRVVFMAPKAHLGLLLSRVYYPNKLSKALFKLGVNTEDWVDYVWARLPERLRARL